MSQNELYKRQKLWEAIANFYLDTELDDVDYKLMVDIFIESNLSLQELKDVDLFEVFPSLQLNLLSVAGQWSGFNEDWVNKECLQNFEKRDRLFFGTGAKLKNKLFYKMRKKHWMEIQRRMKLTM